MHIFNEKFMEAMLTHNLMITPNSSILYQNMCAIPEFHLNLLLKRRCRGSKLFDIFYYIFKLNFTKYPIFPERLFYYSALRAIMRTTCLVHIANRVPFKKMSMKQSKKSRVNCVSYLKTGGYFFCCDEVPQTDPFFGYSMYVPDAIVHHS